MDPITDLCNMYIIVIYRFTMFHPNSSLSLRSVPLLCPQGLVLREFAPTLRPRSDPVPDLLFELRHPRFAHHVHERRLSPAARFFRKKSIAGARGGRHPSIRSTSESWAEIKEDSTRVSTYEHTEEILRHLHYAT